MSKKMNLRQMDAPIYRYWQALYMAFYSRRLYVDVFKRWRGYGILYFLLVMAIVIIPLSVRVCIDFNHYFDNQLMLPIEKLPPLHVQNGTVLFDKPMPYLIKNKEGEIIAIIDTTGKVTGINKTYPHLMLLITKDKLYFRSGLPKFWFYDLGSLPFVYDQVYVQSFDYISNEIFVGKEWITSNNVIKYKWIADLFIYPLLWGGLFGVYIILVLFLAFIGQLLSIIVFKFTLSLKEACRLFLVASTAQVVVFFAMLMNLFIWMKNIIVMNTL